MVTVIIRRLRLRGWNKGVWYDVYRTRCDMIWQRLRCFYEVCCYGWEGHCMTDGYCLDGNEYLNRGKGWSDGLFALLFMHYTTRGGRALLLALRY